MDRISSDERSLVMAHVRSGNTKPEMLVRRLVFSMGYRYRIHYPRLPGKPDLAFPSKKKVIFVHGCFWHRHAGCKLASTPATRTEYWLPKFARTVQRDRSTEDALLEGGWKFLVVWECQLRDMNQIAILIKNFLDQ